MLAGCTSNSMACLQFASQAWIPNFVKDKPKGGLRGYIPCHDDISIWPLGKPGMAIPTCRHDAPRPQRTCLEDFGMLVRTRPESMLCTGVRAAPLQAVETGVPPVGLDDAPLFRKADEECH